MALAREMVRREMLTTYQASRLTKGQSRGLVLGNLELREKIGQGGMGEVFRALHRRMKRQVAVKILPESAVQSKTAVRRFQREVEAAARLAHPNIVTAYDADEQDGIHYLVMEFVDGEDLGSLVDQQGPFTLETALSCIIQAARGLHFAHTQGVIHRDIKPGNLLLDRTNTVKILDMGLARLDNEPVVGDDEVPSHRQLIGTLEYMSPEQADDHALADERSDIYSLGCTLYRILVGRPPYRCEKPMDTIAAHHHQAIPHLGADREDISERLNSVFQRMVAKLPKDRYESMYQVIQHLEACLAESDFDVGAPVLPGDASTSSGDLDESVTEGELTVALGGEQTLQLSGRADTVADSIPTSGGEFELQEIAVGIDLGTTFSAIAYIDREGKPQTLLNTEGEKITPSVILFDGPDVVIGKEAVKALATEMEKIADSPKRFLGKSAFGRAVDGMDIPPTVLQAYILRKLARDAEPQIGPIDKVVITVPAYFDEGRRKATQDAGYIAGLDVIDIVNEPNAGVLAFGETQRVAGEDSLTPRNILIYDLGGGTFDVSVVRWDQQEYRTLATDGDIQLGGRDWDERLAEFVAERFLQRYGVNPRDDPNSRSRLLRECEDAKRTLSARSRAHIVCEYLGNALRAEVTRATFEKMTRDLLDRTAFTTRQCLQASGLKWASIDRVLLVGGSTRMPAVQQLIRELSMQEPDLSVSPDEAIAHGAAYCARYRLLCMAGQEPDCRITNVNPHSLGLVAADTETNEERNVVLIPRNTPLPATARRIFTIKKAGQRSIRVQVVEGESDWADECAQLGRCVVRDLPADLGVGAKIEVCFQYDHNGRLHVSVSIPGIGRNIAQELQRPNSLSQVELDRWRSIVTSDAG
jgi:molecular chaperone DnaK